MCSGISEISLGNLRIRECCNSRDYRLNEALHYNPNIIQCQKNPKKSWSCCPCSQNVQMSSASPPSSVVYSKCISLG